MVLVTDANYTKIGTWLKHMARKYFFWRQLGVRSSDRWASVETLADWDIQTPAGQKLDWITDALDADLKGQEVINDWDQRTQNVYALLRSQYDTERANITQGITTMFPEFIDYNAKNPSVEGILTDLAYKMSKDGKQVKQNTITVTQPTDQSSSNVGTGRLYMYAKTHGPENDNTLVDKETLWPSDFECEVTGITSDNITTVEVRMEPTEREYELRAVGPSVTNITATQTSDGASQNTTTGLGENILTDSSFEGDSGTLLASSDGGWSLAVGMGISTTRTYGSSYSLGAIASSVLQIGSILLGSNESVTSPNDATQSLEPADVLDPDTTYCFVGHVAASGLSSGRYGFRLTGDTLGTVTLAEGTADTGHDFTELSTIVRTPSNMGDDIQFQCYTSNTNVPVYFDKLFMFAPTEVGGLQAAFTPGDVDWVLGDRVDGGNVAVTEGGRYQTMLRDLYGLQLPSGTEASTQFSEDDMALRTVINSNKGDREEKWRKLAVGDMPWVLWTAEPGIVFRDRFISSVPVVTTLLGIVTEQSWEFNGRKGGAVDPDTTNVDPLNMIGGGIVVRVPSAGSADDDYFAFHQDANYPFAVSESPTMFVQGALKQTTDVGFLGGLVGSTNKATSTNLFTLPDDFIGFRLDTDAVDGYGDSSMRVITRSGGTSTETNIGVPLTTQQSFMAVVNDAGTEVKFYVAGTLVATHTTNIPSAQLQFYTAIINRAGGAAATDLEVNISHLHLVQDEDSDFGQ